MMTVYVEDSRIPGTVKGTRERERMGERGQKRERERKRNIYFAT